MQILFFPDSKMGIIFIMFLSAFNLQSQIRLDNKVASYHNLITKAEKKYIEGDYNESIKLYKKSFLYNLEFAFDRYNAIQLAEKLGDYRLKKNV